MKIYSNYLGEKIRKYRCCRGITQADLAIQMGVTKNTIYYWEVGSRKPSIDCMILLSDIMGISLTELMSLANMQS